MKIEFEITDEESVELIRQLQNIVATSATPIISKVLTEIEKDIQLPSEISLRFMMRLRNYTNAPVDMEKTFLEDLQFAPWWLASDNGLAQLCNLTLHDIVKLFGGSFTTVRVSDVKTKKKVKDAVQVLIQKYQS